MKKLSILFLSVLVVWVAFAQAQQGFNYQAVVRNAEGEPLQGQAVSLQITLLNGQDDILYSETHSPTTSPQGVVSITVGKGQGTSSNFADIPWNEGGIQLKVEVDPAGGSSYTLLGTSTIQAVPYALYAAEASPSATAITGSGEHGKVAFWNGEYSLSSLTALSYDSNLEVISNPDASDDDPIFEVKNRDGKVVFGVYQTGVRVYVDDTNTKGRRSGFAVGGLSDQTKSDGVEYFRLTPDSVRFNINMPTGGKGRRSGFAVGGLSDQTKEKTYSNLLFISPDSARIYIDTDQTKGRRSGFAVGGLSDQTKGGSSSFFSVSADEDEIINPSKPRILWYPLKNAFLAGQVLIESPDSVGTNSWASGFESKAIGDYSQALGYSAIARGDYSTAIGREAVADSINSFAFGQFAQAKNQETYAFGRGAIAEGFRSYAFGSAGVDSVGSPTGVTYAKGNYSFAIGMGSQALGEGSFAIGLADTARGDFSLAMGYETSASGLASISMGINSKAVGNLSTAIGPEASAIGIKSIAFGNNTIAEGFLSTAIGNGTEASGEGSTALGYITNAYGYFSTSMGAYTKASDWATAMGYLSEANGRGSSAMGFMTKANGWYSFAAGISTEASQWGAFALGSETEASGSYSTAMGRQTKAIGQSSIAMGHLTIAEGEYSTALGYKTRALQQYSTAMGYQTTAFSNFETVIGRSNKIYEPSWSSSDRLFVIGNGTGEAGVDSLRNAITVLKNSMTAINHDEPTEMLDVKGNARFREIGSGTYSAALSVTEDGTLTTQTSDLSLKTNIVELTNGLSSVLSLRGVKFNWLSNPTGSAKVGFIAQEVEDVLPQVVFTNPNDGYKGVNYAEITAVLVEAVKEQQEIIEQQNNRIYLLEEKNKELESLKTEIEAIKFMLNQ